jgi:hypothetical protein
VEIASGNMGGRGGPGGLDGFAARGSGRCPGVGGSGWLKVARAALIVAGRASAVAGEASAVAENGRDALRARSRKCRRVSRRVRSLAFEQTNPIRIANPGKNLTIDSSLIER